MPDLFGRSDQVFGGGLSSDASWMWWDNLRNAGLGLLVTQMQFGYQQPVRRIYELGPFVGIISSPTGGLVGSVGAKTTIGPTGPIQSTTGGTLTAPTTYTPIGQPVYYVAGRPEGQASLSRIVGPAGLLSGFYSVYGNPCSPYNNLVFRSLLGCINNGSFIAGPVLGASRFAAWIMRGAVITQVQTSATAQEMMVSEQVQLMFVSLNLMVLDKGAWKDVANVPAAQPTGPIVRALSEGIGFGPGPPPST
jgi:hypothetical protein